MLFARLIESQRAAVASRAMLEGAGISAAAHALLIVGWVALHQDIERVAPTAEDRFSPVEYLLPRDRVAGLRPQQETVTWTTIARAAGAGFALPPDEPPPRDEPRLELIVPPGKAQEIDVAMKDFESQPPLILGDSIMTELQVDSVAVRYEDGAAPSYPEALLKRHVEGSVLVQYVVDTLGRADTASFRVMSATHPDFARAVKITLPFMRFRPAMMANRRVPQLVQQPFAFRIVDTTRARTRPPPV